MTQRDYLKASGDPVKIGDLVPYPDNPRQGDIDYIMESIVLNGQYRSIVVRESDSVILAGNNTYEAMVRLNEEGWEEDVPNGLVIPPGEFPFISVEWIDADDDLSEKILLIDNASSDRSNYDFDVLGALLLGRDSLIGTGYDESSTRSILEKMSKPTVALPTQTPDRPQPSLKLKRDEVGRFANDENATDLDEEDDEDDNSESSKPATDVLFSVKKNGIGVVLFVDGDYEDSAVDPLIEAIEDLFETLA